MENSHDIEDLPGGRVRPVVRGQDVSCVLHAWLGLSSAHDDTLPLLLSDLDRQCTCWFFRPQRLWRWLAKSCSQRIGWPITPFNWSSTGQIAEGFVFPPRSKIEARHCSSQPLTANHSEPSNPPTCPIASSLQEGRARTSSLGIVSSRLF